MQKTFIIPCIWQMYEKLEIKAETLEEAKQLAEQRVINFHGSGSQGDGHYIDDSFELDEESIINELNPSDYQALCRDYNAVANPELYGEKMFWIAPSETPDFIKWIKAQEEKPFIIFGKIEFHEAPYTTTIHSVEYVTRAFDANLAEQVAEEVIRQPACKLDTYLIPAHYMGEIILKLKS